MTSSVLIPYSAWLPSLLRGDNLHWQPLDITPYHCHLVHSFRFLARWICHLATADSSALHLQERWLHGNTRLMELLKALPIFEAANAAGAAEPAFKDLRELTLAAPRAHASCSPG